jgi:glutamine synthetase
MVAINAIVAKQLIEFKKDVDARITKGDKKDEAILKELQKLITESKSIRFEGNGYGDEWVKEAKKRGLSNFMDTPRALAVMKSKGYVNLFEELNILTKREIEARHEVDLENYIMKLQIEARILGDICQTHVIPSAIKYQNELIKNVMGLHDVLGANGKKASKIQVNLIAEISDHITFIKENVDKMVGERKKANKLSGSEDMAVAYCDMVKPYFDKIRYHADKLELIIDDEYWRLPKLRELLLTK